MQSKSDKAKMAKIKSNYRGSVGIDKGDVGKVPSNVTINIKRLKQSANDLKKTKSKRLCRCGRCKDCFPEGFDNKGKILPKFKKGYGLREK